MPITRKFVPLLTLAAFAALPTVSQAGITTPSLSLSSTGKIIKKYPHATGTTNMTDLKTITRKLKHAAGLGPVASVGPEPSEWAALGFTVLGIGGLLLKARKRKTTDAT